MAKINSAVSARKQKNESIGLLGVELGKKPPQAIELEEAVLGALMLEKSAIVDIQGLLKPESFYKEAHQKIYKAIIDLSARHEPIDILTVTEELKKNDELDIVGGAYYLSQLTMKVGSAAHAEYHAKIIAQKFIQRELIGISSEIQRDAFDDKVDVSELLDNAQQKIFDVAEGNVRKEALHVSSIVESAILEMETASKREDGFSGVPSGFTSLDRMTLGWQPSDLIIVAARPSMGKTAFVLSMARSIAVDFKQAVAFFSLEMSSVQLVKRLMVSETGLTSDKIRGGRLEPHEWTQLEVKLQQLNDAPLYIDDTPALSIYEFRSKARRLVASHGVRLIIIDYLQLMIGPPELRSMREQEVSAISRSLKAIAKELQVPIIALSQLNRSVETRGGDKRPQLSDLRESGAIEQDADLVAFIHRPEYYGLTEDGEGNSLLGVALLIIAKHRNGAVGDVRMRFRNEEARFYDLEDPDIAAFASDNAPTIAERVTYSSRMNNDFPANNAEFDIFPKGGDVPF